MHCLLHLITIITHSIQGILHNKSHWCARACWYTFFHVWFNRAVLKFSRYCVGSQCNSRKAWRLLDPLLLLRIAFAAVWCTCRSCVISYIVILVSRLGIVWVPSYCLKLGSVAFSQAVTVRHFLVETSLVIQITAFNLHCFPMSTNCVRSKMSPHKYNNAW